LPVVPSLPSFLEPALTVPCRRSDLFIQHIARRTVIWQGPDAPALD
jgi:hypothetical protein